MLLFTLLLCVLSCAAGVPPGSYEVAWVVDVTHADLPNATITLSAEAVPVHGQQQQQQGEAEACEATNSAAAGAGTSSSAAGPAGAAADTQANQHANQHNKVEVQQRWQPELQRLQQQCRMQRATWGVVSGGVLRVSDYSTVQLRFASTDNTYKQNVRWALVELIPVNSTAELQQQQQQQVAAQRNRVWQPARQAGRQGSSSVGVGRGGYNDQHNNGGAAGEAVRGVLGWLERMFGQRFE
jgi:hypothetical protein